MDSFDGNMLDPVGAVPIGRQLIPFTLSADLFSSFKSGTKYYAHNWQSDNSLEAIEILDLT